MTTQPEREDVTDEWERLKEVPTDPVIRLEAIVNDLVMRIQLMESAMQRAGYVPPVWPR